MASEKAPIENTSGASECSSSESFTGNGYIVKVCSKSRLKRS